MDSKQTIANHIDSLELAQARALIHQMLRDGMQLKGAEIRIRHRRPDNWIKDAKTGLLVPDPRSYKNVDDDEVVHNLITRVGRIQIHKGAYGTSGLPTNGFNYIALSNDSLTETDTSTTLSSEITTNGLGRAVGAVVLPTGAGTVTTVDKTFTASGTQSCQKAALFDAASTGNMNHPNAFTQRALISGDTIDLTFSLTIA